MTHIALEQQARDLLERAGVEDAQRFTAGDLVEIANLLGRVAALAAPVEPVAQPVDARLEYRRNILEGISNWLVSRSNTVWAEKHGYTNLMKSWGQDLRDIDAALSATQPAPAVNERIHAPAAPAVPDGWEPDCRSCARCYATKGHGVYGCDSVVGCANADRYQPLPPVKLWRTP